MRDLHAFPSSNQKDPLLVTSFSSCSLSVSDRKKMSRCLRCLAPLLPAPHTRENSMAPANHPNGRGEPVSLAGYYVHVSLRSPSDPSSGLSCPCYPQHLQHFTLSPCVRETAFQGPLDRPLFAAITLCFIKKQGLGLPEKIWMTGHHDICKITNEDRELGMAAA